VPVDQYQYLLLLAGCVAITLPLEIVFSARVYRRPRRLARALAPPLVVFLAWDAFAIRRGPRWFTGRYTTGWRLPLRIPVEELLFFLVVPICALLTYEAVRHVLARGRRA
jgi:lycopene cyclase domain-containing protein